MKRQSAWAYTLWCLQWLSLHRDVVLFSCMATGSTTFKATDLITFPAVLFDYAMHCHVARFYWGETWRNFQKTPFGVCLEMFGVYYVKKLHKYTQHMTFSSATFFGGRAFWHFPESKVPKMACSIVWHNILCRCMCYVWMVLEGPFK